METTAVDEAGVKAMNTPLHRCADLFPSMSEEDYAALKRDIKAHGIKVPVSRWRGQVVDGRHRLQACKELGIEPLFRTVDLPEEELDAFVWSMNGARRHLTPAQRAAIAALMSRESSVGRPRAEQPQAAPPRQSLRLTGHRKIGHLA